MPNLDYELKLKKKGIVIYEMSALSLYINISEELYIFNQTWMISFYETYLIHQLCPQKSHHFHHPIKEVREKRNENAFKL